MPLTNSAFIRYFNARERIIIALLVGIICFSVGHSLRYEPIIKALIAWIGFTTTYLLSSWIIIYRMPIVQIQTLAVKEDGSRFVVHLFILLCTMASLVGIVAAAIAQKNQDVHQITYIVVAVLSLFNSWVLIHTLYIFHYARLYYGQKQAGGLEFPGDEQPDYLDFAYFSLDMGTTFQVSDVVVTSKAIRRVVMYHGLIAFGLNTFVVAIVINLIASLIGS